MLNRALTFLLAALSLAPGFAQDRFVEDRMNALRAKGEAFVPVRLFREAPSGPATDKLWTDALRSATVLEFDRESGLGLLRSRPERVTLELPGLGGMRLLDLERAEVLAPGFQVRVSTDGSAVPVETGLHYRGVVRNSTGTLVAISVYPDGVMGMIGEADDDLVLGPLERDAQGRHVLYRERDLREQRGHACGVQDPGTPMDPEEYRPRAGLKSIRCVTIYWEAAYDLFQNKGSVANVTTYLTGLFNQMATLFSNDGVQVQLQEIFVWNTASPYDATSSSGRLNQFGQVRTSFNGNLAHLIDLGGYGGVAWLNTLCSSTSLRMAYSGINPTYSSVPTYSWSVEVVTHETGHNLGSRHTHACAWNGDNTAIDGCGQAAGYTEGSCPQGPLPSSSVGGTIMSYCHLTSSTIKFANGFGPQPKAVIVNRVNSASCLAQCGTSCDPPEPLTVSGITAISATLGWANFGVSSYTLQWKPSSSGSWTTVTGIATNSYQLTGLTQSTSYDFRVLSVCGSGSSAYSATSSFTTPTACTDPYEPNNTTGTATVITLPTALNALISPAGDNDYFRFTTTATGTISIGLSNLPADYDVRLLNSGGTQLAISQNGGTTSESISYANAPAGIYFVHVFGYNNANVSTVCYLLTVNAFGTACNAPQAVSSSGITWNSAQINWVAVQGASSYELRWKESASPTWTTVTGIGTNTYPLAGLAPLTSYDAQVRSLCAGGSQGGGESGFSATHSFTTLEAPCEVVPRTVVAAKVFLEGPYKTANGLMADSLRKLGLLPLVETYTAMGHAVSGPTTTSPSVLSVTGSNAIVDWVLVELRESSSPYAVVEARAGLLQRDGDIVAPDGSSPLGFCPNAGTYRVAVRHRNHLGVMTGSGVALSGSPTTVDLTAAGTATFGTNARKTIGTVRALWAGNVDPDQVLRYTGQGNDRDPILLMVGGSVPTNTVTGYNSADVNLDGTVKYVGEGNDRDPILQNIGGSVPTNTLQEQLP